LTRLARYERQLDAAVVRFRELTGQFPPSGLKRIPAPLEGSATREYAVMAAARNPDVRGAEALAEAARLERRAAKSERLPQLTGGVDAGRYGVFENERDFDVRGQLVLRQRLFGGVGARENQFAARARAATARSDRIREEAERDAAIAWSDVQALERQLIALEAAYSASRQSRDVIAERFRLTSGTLFDIGRAEEAYFTTATSFIEGLIELDSARYVLLSRTGRLLEAVGFVSDTPRGE
jgi:adhesin transport system outer membrane protein